MNKQYESSIKLLKKIIKEVEDKGLNNSQDFINWLDEINKLSVKY